MEQITTIQEQVQVRVINLQKSMSKSYFESLPTMLRLEISQAFIKNSEVTTTTKLTDDLFRLLQVRERNNESAKDWLLFITSSDKFNRLTAGEIYNAFKLAMSRELTDEKGEYFNLIPDLSINTTARILTAYIEFKRQNESYQRAKANLLAISEPKKGPTEAEKLAIRNEYLKNMFEVLQSDGFFGYSWLEYDTLKSKIGVDKDKAKIIYSRALKSFFSDKEKQMEKNPNDKALKIEVKKYRERAGNAETIPEVQTIARAIAVSDYLLQFPNFEDFIKEFEK